jgi:tripartite-type tricarboxylate transporter receptor subunit TctC
MIDRRTFVQGALGAVPLAALWRPAFAGTWPEHQIRLVVGFPPGQSSDVSARTIARSMSQTLGQSVYVDNRPGAAGIISHETVKNAPADGYTLLLGSSGTLAINPFLYRKLPYDPINDFEPIGTVSASPLVLFTAPDSPLNSFKDFVAAAKARSGKLTYGSSGSGTTGHIAMEMLKRAAGIELMHVPYKGSPAMLTDVIGGQVDVGIDTAGSVLPLARSKRLKPLGIATLKRFPGAPEIPTLAEQGLAGFEAVAWSAILAPKGTPPAVLQRLNESLQQALKDPAVVEQFTSTGSVTLGGSPDQLRSFLLAENQRWGPAVKDSGAQVD